VSVDRQGRRKVAAMGRSASLPSKVQYGREEYAQNFDEGAAVREPENLPRSFSARYARHAPPPRGSLRLPSLA
jgi:hypothetical protein